MCRPPPACPPPVMCPSPPACPPPVMCPSPPACPPPVMCPPPPACPPPVMCPPPPACSPPAMCPPPPPPLWPSARAETSGKQLIPTATARALQFRIVPSERNRPIGNKVFIKNLSNVAQRVTLAALRRSIRTRNRLRDMYMLPIQRFEE